MRPVEDHPERPGTGGAPGATRTDGMLRTAPPERPGPGDGPGATPTDQGLRAAPPVAGPGVEPSPAPAGGGDAPRTGGPTPDPPRLGKVFLIGFLVVLFVAASPAIYGTLLDLTGSPALALLGLVPLAGGLALLYLGLFD